MLKNRIVPAVALAVAFGMSLAGCTNQTTTFPVVSTAYVQLQVVPIPGVPPSSGSWDNAFGVVDQADGYYLLGDRTNAAIDVVSLSSLQFVRFAGKNTFVGTRKSIPSSSGPNSVAVIGNGIAAGSDGNSNVVFVDVTTGLTVANVVVPNTGSTTNRVDLLTNDPKDNILLAGNDAATPYPVATFISSVPPYKVLGQITLTTSTGGVEQPTYDPAQGMFLLSIPSTTANPGGEVDVINPVSEQIVKVYPIGNNCGPTGTSLGPNEELAVSCSNLPAGSQIINATNGSLIATIPVANGCDQNTYNPGDNRFYFACSHPATPIVAVVDANSNQLVTTITTAASANTVAVDPSTNHVFIPLRSGKKGLNVYSYQ